MRTAFGRLGRSRRRLEYNIKMYLTEMGGLSRIEDTSDIGLRRSRPNYGCRADDDDDDDDFK